MSGDPISIQALIRRIMETPPPFRETPQFRKTADAAPEGRVYVGAVVADLLRALGGAALSAEEAEVYRPVKPSKAQQNLARLQLLACHLMYAEEIRQPDAPDQERRERATRANRWLAEGLAELAALVPARDFAVEQDRAEELSRLALRALEILPEGENAAGADDRLATLDSVERRRLVEKSRKAQQRAQELRRKLQEERARESVSKMMRE